jgi:predicted nucleic acid-binding protein
VTFDRVLDSCALAKWVLPETDSDRLLQFAADTVAAGGRLLALDIAFVEVTNAIWKRCRRGLITPAEGQHFIDQLVGLPVHVEPSKPLLKPAYDLAVRYGIAAYDAVFVALTVERGLAGVTSDQPLVRAVNVDYPNIVLLSTL